MQSNASLPPIIYNFHVTPLLASVTFPSELCPRKLGNLASRPITRGTSPPRKIFAPREKSVGHSLKLLDIV